MKINDSLFGTSGIRKIADKELVELALKVGLALGDSYKELIVGGDTRTSSSALRKAVLAGLEAAGARCYDAGVLPTPTLAIAAEDFDAAVMVTASHNPPQYNGLKLINPDGSAFDNGQKKHIEETIKKLRASCVKWDSFGGTKEYEGAITRHINRIKEYFVDDLKGLRLVLDCGGGAGSVITPLLLEGLGCEVIKINCQQTGFFPRGIEPLEKNLGKLLETVRKFGAALGIAHDGDADRMMAVDDKGKFIPGDQLLLLLANAIGAKELITTLDASMAVEEFSFKVKRTPIGDNYVSERLKYEGDFGGEPSGSWIFPNNTLCPDGIIAAVYLAFVAKEQNISEIVEKLPSYPIIRDSIAVDSLVDMKYISEGIKELKAIRIDKTDGYRVSFKDGWLLIRPSGTEPKIRITAEGKTVESTENIYARGIELIKKSISNKVER